MRELRGLGGVRRAAPWVRRIAVRLGRRPPPPASRSLDIDRSVDAAGETLVEAPVRLSDTRLAGPCEIGAFTYFNHGAEVTNARIGRYGSIGQRVLIGPGEHRTDYVTTHPIAADATGASAGMQGSAAYHAAKLTAASRARAPVQPTVIGHDVWIGANAIVMQGVEIGPGAVVGAGAIVTSDVPAYAVVAGSPARLLRFRFEEAEQKALLASRWWEFDLSAMVERDFSDPALFLAALEAADPPPLRPPTARVR